MPMLVAQAQAVDPRRQFVLVRDTKPWRDKRVTDRPVLNVHRYGQFIAIEQGQ